MSIGERPASGLRVRSRASAALAEALLGTIERARRQHEEDGQVAPAAWVAIDELVDALIYALPTPTTGPQTDGNPPERAPAELRPGDRTRSLG